jgi:hypothetical protein
MAKVLDAQTNAPVDVPDADVGAAWQQGKVHLIEGQQYQVKLADGQYGTADAHAMKGVFDAGGSIVSPEEARAAKADALANQIGGATGGGGTAFAGGALSQGTLGVSDQIIHALSPETEAAFQSAAESHPIASMIGQGVGGAAALAATGVGGAAEALGGRALTALGVREGAQLAARPALMALRGAAEGAQFGVAQAISDDAFADHKLTAEQIISTIGANALWGGVISGGIGALHVGAEAAGLVGGKGAELGEEASSTTGALGKILSRADAKPADVEAIAGRALGVDEPAEGLGEKAFGWYKKIASAASGADESAIGAFASEENRKALIDAAETRTQASRDIREHIDNILAANRDITEEGSGSMKRSYISKAVEGVDKDTASAAAKDAMDQTLKSLGEMHANPEDFGGEAPIKRAIKVALKINKSLGEAIESGDVAEQFGLVDDLKKAMGKYTKGATQIVQKGNATDELLSLQNKARAAKYQQLYETLRGGLEDEGVWKQAAKDQQVINAAWSTQIDASDRFHAALTTDTGRDLENPFYKKRGVDPAKADRYVNGLLNPAQDLTHKAVTDYVATTKTLAETMAKTYDLPADKIARVADLGAAADAFQKTLDKTTKSLTLVNQFEQLRHMTSGPSVGFATAAGAMVHGLSGGITGMALGGVAKLFTRPGEAIMQLARVEQMARASDSRVARALRGFIGGKRIAGEALDLSSYARKSAQISRLSQQGDLLAQRIGNNTGALRSRAPKLSTAIVTTSLAGLAFLRDKLPPMPPGDPLNPTAKAPHPPQSVQLRWLGYERAVRDPDSVVEDLQRGRLSPDGVEVLQNVYPSKYNGIRTKVGDMMTEGKMKGLGIQKRLGLALLLDLPTPELDPGYVAARQAAYQQASQPETGPDAGAGGKRGGHRKMNLTKQATTLSADRVESGGMAA